MADAQGANIYLVGFMGAGKTSIGRCMARLLGWDFVDLDEAIEKSEGRAIRDIFAQDGEPFFRKLEREQLRQVSLRRQHVIAIGGGAFCDPENRRVIEGTGTSVWLDAPLDVIFSRCDGDTSRPLFADRPRMEALLEARRPHYEQATFRIDVTGSSVDAIAARILALIAN